MKQRPPLIDEEGEVREVTATDLRDFKPARDALPADVRKVLRVRGPQRAPTKVATTLRFDADVLAALKATGRGWQSRVNAAMRDWVKARGG